MNKNIRDIRQEYLSSTLNEKDVLPDPIAQFEAWMQQALDSQVQEPTAFTLSTVGANGIPAARIVLLKEIQSDGLVFFTNYNSHKGKQLAENPLACMNFFWPDLHRQVRITGTVEKCSESLSAEYFNSRPVGSRLAAIVSEQSEPINDRDSLDKKYELKSKVEEAELKKPEHWGGYIVKPVEFEFWQGRANRLHDRLLFKKSVTNWIVTRLQP